MSSVMSRCVLGVVSLVCARHAQHFVLQNGSIGPQIAQVFHCAALRERAFLLQREGARRKKGTDFFYILAFCVSVVSRVRARHAQVQFFSTKWQYRPRNCSIFPLRGLTRRGLFIAKGGARRKKPDSFFLFGVFYCSRCFWCTCWEHDCSNGVILCAQLNSSV